MCRIISVTNQKGGVGKTTTTVNLAALLAQESKRVLLADIDPQGNATSGVGVDKEKAFYSMFDVLTNDVQIAEALCPTMIDGLKVLPSNIHLAGAEVALVGMDRREFMLKEKLDEIRDMFDYILIDCPPSLGLLTLNALSASDAVLVPIQCEYYALEGLTQLMSSIRLVKHRLNPTLDIDGVLLTMYDSRMNLTNQVAGEVRRYFKEKVYKTVIPRNVRLSEAPSHGLPIHLYDSKSSGAEAYRQLTKEFLLWNEKTA